MPAGRAEGTLTSCLFKLVCATFILCSSHSPRIPLLIHRGKGLLLTLLAGFSFWFWDFFFLLNFLFPLKHWKLASARNRMWSRTLMLWVVLKPLGCLVDRSLPKLQVKQAVRFRVQKSLCSGQKAEDCWVPLEHGDGLLHRVAGDVPQQIPWYCRSPEHQWSAHLAHDCGFCMWEGAGRFLPQWWMGVVGTGCPATLLRPAAKDFAI